MAIPITGHITANRTFTADKTYKIIGDVTVDSGVTLTINAGTVIKFATATSSLTVNGTLNANGTDASKVYFTSINDDSVGTDLTASSTVATSSDWGFIRASTSSVVKIEGAVVRYGGAADVGMISNYGGTLRIASSTVATSTYGVFTNGGNASTSIKYSTVTNNMYGVFTGSGITSIGSSTVSLNQRGVYVTGGQSDVYDSSIFDNTYGLYSDNVTSLLVDTSDIHGNGTGVYIDGGEIGANNINSSDIRDNNYGIVVNSGTARVYSNLIMGNSTYGLLSNDGSTTTKATYNAWGSASGPSGQGSGTGDAVSSDVLFTPFATSALNFVKVDLGGNILTAVDGNNKIYWDGTPYYVDAWNAAVKIWNDQNIVEIATTTGTTTATMHLVTDTLSGNRFAAAWDSNDNTLHVNTVEMSNLSLNGKINAIAHELGHALGLSHSKAGNIMYLYTTGTTTLGSQDILDYNFVY